jgi:hypothetical protein
MLRKKTNKKPSGALLAGVQKEMAQPRMDRSSKIAKLKLETARNPEPPSATVPGTVAKILPSPSPSKPEKAQITIDVPDRKYRNLRIDDELTDEHGDDVKLKKGARVDITVTENQKTVNRHAQRSGPVVHSFLTPQALTPDDPHFRADSEGERTHR